MTDAQTSTIHNKMAVFFHRGRDVVRLKNHVLHCLCFLSPYTAHSHALFKSYGGKCFQNNAWLRPEIQSTQSRTKTSRLGVLPIQVEHHSPWQRELAKETREDDRFVWSLRRAPAEGGETALDQPWNPTQSSLLPADKYQFNCPWHVLSVHQRTDRLFFKVRFLCELNTVQSIHCAVLEKCPACR